MHVQHVMLHKHYLLIRMLLIVSMCILVISFWRQIWPWAFKGNGLLLITEFSDTIFCHAECSRDRRWPMHLASLPFKKASRWFSDFPNASAGSKYVSQYPSNKPSPAWNKEVKSLYFHADPHHFVRAP